MCSALARCLHRAWPAAIMGMAGLLSGQEAAPALADIPVHLQVGAGTPLRVYITKRVSYRAGDVVSTKLIEPVWAFDRIVLPAGSIVQGQVTSLEAVSNMARATAMIRGDFTPLKHAEVSFSKLVLVDGRGLDTETAPSLGLTSIYVPPKPNTKAKPNQKPIDPNTKTARLRALAKQQAQAQMNARSQGFLALVRAPNRREWLEDFLWSKLPYHPQWYRTGTRFDAILSKPLDFGTVRVAQASLKDVGAPVTADQAAMIQLSNTVTSLDARVGDPIRGVLSTPLFSPDHQLVLPEGTGFHGKVTLARRARMFHRGGQLRFVFDQVQPPEFLLAATAPKVERTQAQLAGAEGSDGPVTVDAEGTAKATESKTRFLRPVIAGLIAARSADNDEGKQGSSAGGNANYSGRSLGGFSGFGLLGTAASQGPRPIGTALGYYGLAWSVYSTVISRGREVTFEKNTALAIRFGAPVKGR